MSLGSIIRKFMVPYSWIIKTMKKFDVAKKHKKFDQRNYETVAFGIDEKS